MTIEKEAIDVVLENLYESGLSGYCAVISKALKAKQDRIDELESALKPFANCVSSSGQMIGYDPTRIIEYCFRAKKAIGGGK